MPSFSAGISARPVGRRTVYLFGDAGSWPRYNYMVALTTNKESIMIPLNVTGAKAHWSKYLYAVEAGETVVLGRRNVPIA